MGTGVGRGVADAIFVTLSAPFSIAYPAIPLSALVSTSAALHLPGRLSFKSRPTNQRPPTLSPSSPLRSYCTRLTGHVTWLAL